MASLVKIEAKYDFKTYSNGTTATSNAEIKYVRNFSSLTVHDLPKLALFGEKISTMGLCGYNIHTYICPSCRMAF